MKQKYFPLDKNYLLEKAQLSIENDLIIHLIDRCKLYYETTTNPLGLIDDTVACIRAHQSSPTGELSELYRHLCGIYRYKHGDNQLEFLFDGSDHLLKYESDWKLAFDQWLDELVKSPLFIRAILELTVFYSNEHKGALAAGRLKVYIEQHFGLKLYKYRGIVESQVA